MRGSADISTSATSTFSRAQRRALGIAEWDEQGSYHRVERLVLRVTEVLEGWSTIASTPAASDPFDVLNLLVEASCPPELTFSRSVAIDGTDVPTSGRLSSVTRTPSI